MFRSGKVLAASARALAASSTGWSSVLSLLAGGVSRHALESRTKNGDLHRKHRGVYIVGHLALPSMAMESAALLACGEGGLISHRSAAYIWSMVETKPQEVDITLVGRRCRPKEGVRIHGVARIDRRDVGRKGEIALTDAARTLIDLAADVREQELERAVSEARVLGLLREGPEGDFLWPDQRVIVEAQGYRYHRHRGAFERDDRKAMAVENAGYHVIRITWRQLVEDPLAVVAQIARALERRS
jgi:Protein of unknown function (DUF559)